MANQFPQGSFNYDPNYDPFRSANKVIEPIMTLGSAMAGMIPTGYAHMISPEAGQRMQDATTYIPRTPEGMEGLTSLANSYPIQKMQDLSQWYDGKIDKYGEGHPLLQTIAATLPTAATLPRGALTSAAMGLGSKVNQVHRALGKLDPILMNVETSTASRADDIAETLRRFKEASASAKYNNAHLSKAMNTDYPMGQGVWTGEEGTAQFHPNVMANMSHFHPEEINAMREYLGQYGIGAGRFRPDLIQQPSRANAMQVMDANPQWIKDIGAHYAANDIPAVVFSQPNNRAMLFNMNTDSPSGLTALRDAPMLKGKKVRYGQSREQLDRNYIDSVESARATGTKKTPKKVAKGS